MTPWWLGIARFAVPHWRGLGAVVLLMLGTVGLELLKPWPLKLIVDNVLGGRPLPASASWIVGTAGRPSTEVLLGWLSLGMIVIFLMHQALRLMQAHLQSGLGNRMVYDLGAQLFDHLQRLSLSFHGSRAAGDLVRRVTSDTGCVRDLIMWVGLLGLSSLVTFAAMLAVMWQLDPLLSLIALLVGPPLMWLIKRSAGPMAEREYEYEQLAGAATASAEQTLMALPVVQTFGRERAQTEGFQRMMRQAAAAQLRVTTTELKFKLNTDGIIAIGTGAIILIGGWHVINAKLTVGGLIVFLSYLASLYAPMETIAYLSSGYAQAAARARRVNEILNKANPVVEAIDARPLPSASSGAYVRFDHVSFGYQPGHAVLHDVTFDACPGDTIALVGSTGAGKSTLVSLLLRFFDPWHGAVLIDGVDIRATLLASLRANVTLVPQEPFILPLTIAQNIAYGRPDATMEDIVAAATVANAHSFIRGLPDGYHTVVGERGMTLSGGQRQRLSIARAFLKGGRILIFDEPTAALDAENESQIVEAIERLMSGRTSIIIAHRLSTIRRATKVLVLEGGRVVEMGTHDELIAMRGAYHSLYELQVGGQDGSVLLPRGLWSV